MMCVPGDMDLFNKQLESDHVSGAWMTWSASAEFALSSAYYLAGGPLRQDLIMLAEEALGFAPRR